MGKAGLYFIVMEFSVIIPDAQSVPSFESRLKKYMFTEVFSGSKLLLILIGLIVQGPMALLYRTDIYEQQLYILDLLLQSHPNGHLCSSTT